MIYPPQAGEPRKEPCPECNGEGEIDQGDDFGTVVCSDCDGTGEIEVEDD